MTVKNEALRDFFYDVKPIRFAEPLAETLGALKRGAREIEYGFPELVKMAGHACPTIAGAFLCCEHALEKLYPAELPVRGMVSVTVHGEPDEGVYGVMGQAFSFITEKARRLSELLEKIIWEAATEEEREEFQELWMGKVRSMLIERKEINKWLIVEERNT